MIYTPFVWPFVISSALLAGIALYVRRYSNIPAVRSLSILMELCGAFSLFYALNLSTTEFDLKSIWVKLQTAPAIFTPVVTFFLIVEHIGRREWLTRRNKTLILIVPFIFLFLELTNSYHHLTRYNFRLVDSNSFPIMVSDKGIFFWVYQVYAFVLAVGSSVVLLSAFRYKQLSAANTTLLVLGLLTPLLSNTLYIAGVTSIRGFNPTPVMLVITGILYSWVLLQFRLFNVVHIARDTVLETIEDMIIVLDAQGNIADMNLAARKILASTQPFIGSSPQTFPQAWAEILQKHAETISGKEEAVINDQIYELDITPIQENSSRPLGKIFRFQNITLRKRAEADERQQRILAEALQETAQALSSTLDYDSVLDKILENIERVVPIDSANIALLDERKHLQYIRFHGYQNYKISEAELKSLDFSLDSAPIFKRAFESGQPIIIPDTHADPQWIITSSGSWIRSYAVMPIRVKEKVVGFLNLDSAVLGMYTPEHVHNLRAFADQTAIAFENARLFDALEHEILERKYAEEKILLQNNYLSMLHQITLDLLDHQEPESLLKKIAECAAMLVNTEHGFIFLSEGDNLVMRAATSGFVHNVGNREPKPGNGVLKAVWESGENLVIENYSEWTLRDPKYKKDDLRAIAGVPIKAGNELIGVLEVANIHGTRIFSEAEIEILNRFAALVSLVIDNMKLASALQFELTERTQAELALNKANQELQKQLEQIEKLQTDLQEQVIRDPLTGLYNRRYLSETLERELARAERETYPVSFVMIDIDHFKNINDAFGHDAGDLLLKKLASLLVSQTRVGDIVYRYGGEEILVILPNVTVEATHQITERWRTTFMGATLPLKYNNTRATISCGISAYPIHGRTANDLITFADKAMYQAKAAGRNQVTIWDTEHTI